VSKPPTPTTILFNFGPKLPDPIGPPIISVAEALEEILKFPGAEVIYTGPSEYGWHEVGLFLRCPQLYEHVDSGRLPGERMPKDYLTRGSLVHTGLAHYYARIGAAQPGGVLVNGKQSNNPDDWHKPLVGVALAAEYMRRIEKDPFAMPLLPLAQSLTQLYIEHIRGSSKDYGIRILGVEHPAEIPCEGYPYTAGLDLVVQTADGMVQLWDHKILARPDKGRAMYSYSGQIHGHRAIGQRLWGLKFGGVRLNILGADPKACLDTSKGIDGAGLVGVTDCATTVPMVWGAGDANDDYAFNAVAPPGVGATRAALPPGDRSGDSDVYPLPGGRGSVR